MRVTGLHLSILQHCFPLFLSRSIRIFLEIQIYFSLHTEVDMHV